MRAPESAGKQPVLTTVDGHDCLAYGLPRSLRDCRPPVAKKSSSSKNNALPDFEGALAELEKIVEKMEAGDQSLEEALASFQRGIELTRTCQKGLKEAEQRVEKLVQENNVAGADSDDAS